GSLSASRIRARSPPDDLLDKPGTLLSFSYLLKKRRQYWVSPGNSFFGIMSEMDVYLSEGARRYLRAQILEISRGGTGGLLLGHRRGPRFFVESVYPCPLRLFLSVEKYHALSHVFDDKIIGFYSSSGRMEDIERRLPPFAVNKLYLEFGLHRRKGLTLRPAVIEYDGSFHLVPVEMAPPPKGRE
ncbi:MAG: hypothetical protein WBC70_15330, partial [Candidatus Aminicenantales bacterium]